jgi:superfamily II DNA or RNA helicase
MYSSSSNNHNIDNRGKNSINLDKLQEKSVVCKKGGDLKDNIFSYSQINLSGTKSNNKDYLKSKRGSHPQDSQKINITKRVNAINRTTRASNTLTSNSPTSNSLTTNSVTSNTLTSNSLTSKSLTNNSGTSNALSNNSLTSTSLTNNALASKTPKSDIITNKSITLTNSNLASGTLTSGTLTSGTLTSGILTSGTLTSGTLTTGTLTTGTLTSGTLTSGTLTSGTLTTGTLTSGTLTSGTLTSGTLTSGTLTSGTLTSGTLTSGTLTSGTLTTGTLTSGTLTSGTLTSGTLTSGTLTSGTLTSGTLTSGVLTSGTLTSGRLNTINKNAKSLNFSKEKEKAATKRTESMGNLRRLKESNEKILSASQKITLCIKEGTEKPDALGLGLSSITPFQKAIIDECIEKGSGGLSLPMGTGKTRVSTIVGLLQEKNHENGKILVVVSKSLISNWKEELDKVFGDTLSYQIVHKDYIRQTDTWKCTAKVILTTPEIITKSYNNNNIGPLFWYHHRPDVFGPMIKYYRVPIEPYLDHKIGLGALHSIKWATLIIDEAQCYQNIESNRCLAIASLSAHNRWLLSGTLFDEPRPEKLLGYYILLNHPTAPRNIADFIRLIKSDYYLGLLSTLVFRDNNDDFIPPTIKREIVSHPLTHVEALIYKNIKNILKAMKDKLLEHKREGDSVNAKKFSSYMVGMITHLRQCLVCPLIPITNVAIDLADFEQKSELSQIFMDCIENLNLSDWLNDIDSLYSSRLRSVNAKLEEHSDTRVVVFSCFRKVLKVLQLYIQKDRPVFTITGTQKIDQRQRVIDQFRESTNGVLLLTYDIGANGLNLQTAHISLLIDTAWNVGIISQAISRTFRLGQLSDSVMIYYFTSNTGIENAILKLQLSKKQVTEELMTGCVKSEIKKITTDEIVKLLDIDDNVGLMQQLM